MKSDIKNDVFTFVWLSLCQVCLIPASTHAGWRKKCVVITKNIIIEKRAPSVNFLEWSFTLLAQSSIFCTRLTQWEVRFEAVCLEIWMCSANITAGNTRVIHTSDFKMVLSPLLSLSNTENKSSNHFEKCYSQGCWKMDPNQKLPIKLVTNKKRFIVK